MATGGDIEAIIELGKYYLSENSFTDAMSILFKGSNDGNSICQNTVGVLSTINAAKNVIDDTFDMISMVAEQNDKFALPNIGLKFLRENKVKESIEILERANKLGFGHAGFLLGLTHETNGLIDDNAIKFYRKAAKDKERRCALSI